MSRTFTLDGCTVEVDGPWDRSLLTVMREDLDCMGAKPGCEIGRCGACTVLLDGAPVAACLVPLGRLDGKRVTTAQGLPAELVTRLFTILREEHVAQCGYCSNGLLVTLTWLIECAIPADQEEARGLLAGHLCRCAGHVALDRILDRIVAMRSLTIEAA